MNSVRINIDETSICPCTRARRDDFMIMILFARNYEQIWALNKFYD